MAYKELADMWMKDWPDPVPMRVRELDALDRMRDGSIYDKLPYPYTTEYDDQGTYVPLTQRRPAVKYGITKVVVDETASLTFGEGHSPYVRIYDPFNPEQANTNDTAKRLTQIIEFVRHVTKMDAVMFESIQKGSSGSCCAILRTTRKGTPWIRVVSGKHITPKFDDNDPNELVSIAEIYKTDLKSLIDKGYTFAELGIDPEKDKYNMNDEYWCNITTDAKVEQWMKPLKRSEFNKIGKKKDPPATGFYDWIEDPLRTYSHKWGEVPAVWGRNLHEREDPDGPSTYDDIKDMAVEIDYLISQIGRGFKYSMDPLMAEKPGDTVQRIPLGGGALPGSSSSSAAYDRTPARKVVAPPGGDLKMLEIQGSGLTAAREWVKLVREWAMEVAGGMKSDQEHAGGPQSGRALELLHQALVWLVGRMRIDYGDGFMVPLIKLILRGVKLGLVKLWGVNPEDVVDDDYPLRLIWPSWWQPRGADLYQTAQALLLAAGGSSREGKQMMPMQMIFEYFAAAMGHPDPTQVAQQAAKEFETYREEQLKILMPKPAAGNATGGSGS